MPQSQKAGSKPASQDPDDEFVFQTGPAYAQKDEYAAKSLKFDILSVAFEPNRGFDGHDRWVICVAPDDGRGEELITLQANEKRDTEMRGAQAFIKSRGPIKNARLKRNGKTYYFQSESKSATA